MRFLRQPCTFAFGLLLSATVMGGSHAQAPDNFYKGKVVELIISSGPGNNLDQTGRLIARHLPKYLPGNPTVVAKNMPGAGHIRAANYIYNQGAQDGTVIGTLIPSFVLAQVLVGTGVQFDATKFQWLGSTSSSNSVTYVWAGTSKAKSLEDAMKAQVLMGATGAGSNSALYPTIMNNVLGTKFKLITGYGTSNEVNLAMERGEVEGRAGHSFNSLKTQNAEWLRDGKITILTQFGLEREPELKNVPLAFEFAKSDQDREILKLFSADAAIGQPYLVGPRVPAERVALLRRAFDATLNDPEFRKEAEAAGLDLNPVPGAKLQTIVEELVHASPEVINRAKTVSATKEGGVTE
jgi:tripartite-type tricarboxylate transporter receptor subunit TctC